MNFLYGSKCAIALLVVAAILVFSVGTANAQQSGGGGTGGGDNAQFANFVPIPYTGNIDGWIVFLDPNNWVAPSFPYWQESAILNGTTQSVTFYQTVYMFDNNGNQVDGISFTTPVPPMMALMDWVVSKEVVMPTGLYSLEGELGYLQNGNQVILDTEDEDFGVAN